MISTLSSNLTTEEEAFSIIDFIVKNSEAEEVSIAINGSKSSLSRFSENQISQNISKNRFNIKITSYFGEKNSICFYY